MADPYGLLSRSSSRRKQWIWIPIISLFILAGLIGAGAAAGLLVIDSSSAARVGLVKWVTLWLSGCVAADTIITAVLVLKFRTINTTFLDTESLIRRRSEWFHHHSAESSLSSSSRFNPRRIIPVAGSPLQSQLTSSGCDNRDKPSSLNYTIFYCTVARVIMHKYEMHFQGKFEGWWAPDPMHYARYAL
ncbi:hypothetical protein DFH09DRAFT_1079817 [Mycena vulgaris]|nr:hypothetical protein DFH09DRAFT_1079817 [Mycena vulgaris]